MKAPSRFLLVATHYTERECSVPFFSASPDIAHSFSCITNAMRNLLCLLALASILLSFHSAFGQTDSLMLNGSQSPFWISTGHSYVGADVGITGTDYFGAQNFLWGITSSTNPNTGALIEATYLPYGSSLGAGIGFVGGIKLGLTVLPSFDIEAKARYVTNHTSKQLAVSGILLDPFHPGNPAPLSDGTNNYSLTLSSFDGALLGHVHLTDHIYLAGGGSLSDLIMNRFSASQHVIAAGGYRTLNTHTLLNSNDQSVGPEQLTNWFVGFRAAAQIGGGYVFRLGAGNWLMDVEALLSMPLTRWQTTEADSLLNSSANYWQQPAITDPHLWYMSLTVGIRMPFHDLPPLPKLIPIVEPAPTPIPSPSPSTSIHNFPLMKDTSGFVLSGKVLDELTGKPLEAEMTAIDLSNNQIFLKTHSDTNGVYSVHVDNPGKYSITADAPGHLFGTTYFEVDSEGRILRSPDVLRLGSLTSGKTRLLVFFDFDKAEIKPASIPELNHTVEMMNRVPEMRVEIAGYSDSIGTLSHNLDLSARRAKAVRQYLIQHGIATDRLTAKGYGPVPPIAPNSTDEGRAENRRVEFVVKQQ